MLTEDDLSDACNRLIRIRNEENRREVNIALYCVLDKWFSIKDDSKVVPTLTADYSISWEKKL